MKVSASSSGSQISAAIDQKLNGAVHAFISGAVERSNAGVVGRGHRVAQIQQEPDQFEGLILRMLADEAVRPAHSRGCHQGRSVIEGSDRRIGVMRQEKTGDFEIA